MYFLQCTSAFVQTRVKITRALYLASDLYCIYITYVITQSLPCLVDTSDQIEDGYTCIHVYLCIYIRIIIYVNLYLSTHQIREKMDLMYNIYMYMYMYVYGILYLYLSTHTRSERRWT